jgi:hypothetical protein
LEISYSAVVIQWDEKWTPIEHPENRTDFVEPVWGGSIVKLPFNLDIQTDSQSDAVLANFIGRKYPVSYYGTQVSESVNINTLILKDDINTLYALRRLAKWNGNVYIREPSGTGYWASVTVNLDHSYDKLWIPVSIRAVRVEGGM